MRTFESYWSQHPYLTMLEWTYSYPIRSFGKKISRKINELLKEATLWVIITRAQFIQEWIQATSFSLTNTNSNDWTWPKWSNAVKKNQVTVQGGTANFAGWVFIEFIPHTSRYESENWHR